MSDVSKVFLWTDPVWPARGVYFSEANYKEYQDLVDSTWSVQFVDTGQRFRFNHAVYIWNRTALDFNGSTMRVINLDTLTTTSSKTCSIDGRVRYFWDNRLLTQKWIADFDWNIITSFAWTDTFTSITPWDVGVIWAWANTKLYKWVVEWDNVTWSLITTQTWWDNKGVAYWKLWPYFLCNWESSSNRNYYINPSNNSVTSFTSPTPRAERNWRRCVAWPDWKAYRLMARDNGWWRLQKLWTTSEWVVWTSLATTWWIAWGGRFGKFLWNIVSWNMNTSNWTWNWLWSNSYFIATDWTLTLAQSNAFAYDTHVYGDLWFIDENWWLYPKTEQWWTWVILKTDKTFTNLNWKNPYLWR